MSNFKEQIRQEIDKWIYNTDEWEVSPGKYNKSESEVYKVGWRCGLGHIREFIDSLPEEKPSEDLNDEIKKFIEEYGYERGEDKLLIAIVARHFAEWQKEQMMKDAVEGEIGYWNQRGLSIRLDQSFEKLGYGEDTKVKIIIVKED